MTVALVAAALSALALQQPALHFEAAASYSGRHNGHAVVVMVDGKIVFERYDNGYKADQPHELHSGTKTFWGPAIAAMIEDGLVESLDEPVARTISEWQSDPRRGRITIRHLLDLTAGLPQDIARLQGDRPTLAPNLFSHAVALRSIDEPGVSFVYGPSNYYVLGEVMKRKLASRRQTPLDYLKQRVLDPIGLRLGEWTHDAAGNPHMPNGARVTAREWMKFGELLLGRGDFHGRRVIAAERLRFEGSRANTGYGFTAWLNIPGGRSSTGRSAASQTRDRGGWIYPPGLPDLFMAAGANGQRLYVVPSMRMIVLRFGASPAFDDAAFLRALL